MPLPNWKIEYGKIPLAEHSSVPALLREMHRARLLGAEVRALEIDGKLLDDRHLALLNDWIAASGASNASRQNYFEAWARLKRIINHEVTSEVPRRRSREVSPEKP